MKRKKTLWARTVPAVAFGVLMSFAVLVHTPVSADESSAAEPSEEANQLTLAQADTESPAGLAAAVNLNGLAESSSAGEDFEDDPFESFNEKMFWFNREVVDRYVLKPIATGWDFLLPDPVQRGVHNFFDNLAVVRRVVNYGLQL